MQGDTSSIPGLGRSPEERNDNPLQYSCLGNPMDRGAWEATAHGVSKSQTWLNTDTHTHTHTHTLIHMCQTLCRYQEWNTVSIFVEFPVKWQDLNPKWLSNIMLIPVVETNGTKCAVISEDLIFEIWNLIVYQWNKRCGADVLGKEN